MAFLTIRAGSLTHALFGFKGRAKRLDYWLGLIGLAVARVVVLVMALGFTHMRMGEPEALPLRLGLDVAFFWPSAAIVIKRGHDRNRPTLYSTALVSGLYASGVAFGLVMDAQNTQGGAFCLLALLIGSLYMLIDYGLLDGTRGQNRYGPSPKGAPSEGVGEDLGAVFD